MADNYGIGGGVTSRKQPPARGGRSSRIYGTPPISAMNGTGQTMQEATAKSPPLRIKMSTRLATVKENLGVTGRPGKKVK